VLSSFANKAIKRLNKCFISSPQLLLNGENF
jgi:hypothetical protein